MKNVLGAKMARNIVAMAVKRILAYVRELFLQIAGLPSRNGLLPYI
jgi:hypothetical protein